MALKIIAAVASNGVIGRKGSLPLLWKLSDDMKWFAKNTGSSPVAMGSKTYWSLPDRFRPLPNRENIVLTRHPESFKEAGITALADFEKVIERAKTEEIFVIGGADIYALALPYAQEMYLTRVHVYSSGDAYFPEWNAKEWHRVFSETRGHDRRNEYGFTWEIWRRS